jgi:hypothetical protein
MNPKSLPKPVLAASFALLAGLSLRSWAQNAPQTPVFVPPPGLGIPVISQPAASSANTAPAPQPDDSPAPKPAEMPAAKTAAISTPSAETAAAPKAVLDLISSLSKFDQEGRDPAHKLGFELPESSVNDYIAYVLRTRPRPGVHKLRVSLQPRNQIAFEAEVDFTAVAEWLSWTPPDALKSMLTGHQTVRLNLEFESRNGAVTLKWKDAFGPGNQPVPSAILTTVLKSLGAHQPEGFDTTKPIPLPYGLKRIWTDKQSLGGET